MLQAFLLRWRSLNEWVRAALLACLLLSIGHIFLLRFVRVRSTSMYATLLPGDLVAVTPWRSLTGLVRGDIAVFHDPVQDDRALSRRDLLIKRIVGMPGDTVRLVNGRLFVNGERLAFKGVTHSHLVRLRAGTDPTSLLDTLGLPADFVPPDRSYIELPLDLPLVRGISGRADVRSAEMIRLSRGAPRHIFPFSPAYPWNSDDYGPIRVPARADTLRITPVNIALFDRLITRYEGRELSNSDDALTIDGVTTTAYVVRQDHYFVMGDCRHYSTDSRYWGFVPHDHLVGRAAFIVLPARAGGLLGSRLFKEL